MRSFITKDRLKVVIGILILSLNFLSSSHVFYGSIYSYRWYFFYYGKFFASCFIILMALLQWRKEKKAAESVIGYLKIHLVPRIIIFAYSLLIWFFIGAEFGYYTRGVSTTVFRVIAILSGIAFVYIYKEKALRYGFYSVIINYSLVILIAISKTSLLEFFRQLMYIGQTRNVLSIGDYLEVNETIYTLGLYLVCYIVFVKCKSKADKVLIFLGIFYFVLGNKRIGFLALITALLIPFILKKFKIKNTDLIKDVGATVAIVLCMTYVFLVSTGLLNKLFGLLHINSMGRNILYYYFSRFSDYSITFFGRGLGSVSKLLEAATWDDIANMAGVRGLHNDIFKMYFEIGFIGCILWLWYYLEKIPRYLTEKFNFKISDCYCLLTVYMFITYLTDNTEGYFTVQLNLTLIPLALYYFNYHKDIIAKNKLSEDAKENVEILQNN